MLDRCLLPSIGKEGLLEERECFLHFLIRSRLGRSDWSIGTLADWLVLQLIHHFWPESLSFSGLFASST